MEIRKEIESLALWYIPAFALTLIFSAIYSSYLKELMDMGQVTTGKSVVFASMVLNFIGNIDNLVLGVWLFMQAKKENGKPILWLFFGLVAHFYAAIIYIGLKIYENQKAYNKSLKSGTPESGAP